MKINTYTETPKAENGFILGLDDISRVNGVYEYLTRDGGLSTYSVVSIDGCAYCLSADSFTRLLHSVWSDTKFRKSNRSVTVTFSNS